VIVGRVAAAVPHRVAAVTFNIVVGGYRSRSPILLAFLAIYLVWDSTRLPRDVRQSTALQLLAGAVWLAAASGATGEWRGFAVANVTPASAAALIYLIVFGSVVAFTAYIWLLLEQSRPAEAAAASASPQPPRGATKAAAAIRLA
jgi:hypothetical protein